MPHCSSISLCLVLILVHVCLLRNRGMVPASYVSVSEAQYAEKARSSRQGSQRNSGYGYGADAYSTTDYYYGDQQKQQPTLSRADTSNSERTFMQQGGEYEQQHGPGGYDEFGDAADEDSVGYSKPSQPQWKAAPSFKQQASLSAASSYKAAAGNDEAATYSYPATVMFEFTAEQENELSVRVGDEILVRAEIDGWYQATRVSDGVSGLIPASYAQMH